MSLKIGANNNIPKGMVGAWIGNASNVPKKILNMWIGDENNVPKLFCQAIVKAILSITFEAEVKYSEDSLTTIVNTSIVMPSSATADNSVYDDGTNKWYVTTYMGLYSYNLDSNAPTFVLARRSWIGMKDSTIFAFTENKQLQIYNLSTAQEYTLDLSSYISGTIISAQVANQFHHRGVAKDNNGYYAMSVMAYTSESVLRLYRVTFQLSGVTPSNVTVTQLTTQSKSMDSFCYTFFNGTNFITMTLGNSGLQCVAGTTVVNVASYPNGASYPNLGCFEYKGYYYMVTGGTDGSKKLFCRTPVSNPGTFTIQTVFGGYDSNTSPFYNFTSDGEYVYGISKSGRLFRSTDISNWTQMTSDASVDGGHVRVNMNNDKGMYYSN